MNRASQIRIMTVVGARPNFMKAAPIIKAIEKHNRAAENRRQIHHLLVHTGQHYDAIMSDRFFADLALPEPDIHLGVGSGSHALQTAEILKKFETVLSKESPDVLIVVGDVNSTLACALAASKFSSTPSQARPLIAHVEAGLRSFDRDMPEEINRVLTDHLADLLFVTEKAGLKNLRREGISAEKIFFVGNTMIDSLLAFKKQAEQSHVLDHLGLRRSNNGNRSRRPASAKQYALLTLHRPSNVDDRESFQQILEGLSELARESEIIFPVHPRTCRRIEEFGFQNYFSNSSNGQNARIRLIDPLGYLDFVCVMKNARLVLTDSGGIQEETTCLGIPCVTIRENTERPVTVTHGTNIVAGISPTGIRKAITRQMVRKRKGSAPEKWDGKSAQRIVAIMAKAVSRHEAAAGKDLSPCVR